MGEEAALSEEGTLRFAAGVGIIDEVSVPPISADIIDKMMDDAITERGGDDFADDGIADDEGDAAAGAISLPEN